MDETRRGLAAGGSAANGEAARLFCGRCGRSSDWSQVLHLGRVHFDGAVAVAVKVMDATAEGIRCRNGGHADLFVAGLREDL